MKRLALIHAAAALAVALTVPPQADAQTLYTCGQGTVRGVESVTETVTRRTVPTQPSRDKTAARVEPASRAHRHSYLVKVKLNDLVYTGQSSAGIPWNFDPTVLAINETITVCANSTQMVLDRLDGTDYRATIVRVEREPEESSVRFQADGTYGTARLKDTVRQKPDTTYDTVRLKPAIPYDTSYGFK